MSPSIWQIIIVVAIFAVLFLGPKRLPGVGKSIGEAIRGFKKGLDDDAIDVTDSAKEQVDGQSDAKNAQTQTAQQEPEKQS